MSQTLTMLTAGAAIALVVSMAKPQTRPDGKSMFRFDTFGDEQLWTRCASDAECPEDRQSCQKADLVEFLRVAVIP